MDWRIFLDVLLRPWEVFKAQKKKSDLRKALALHALTAFLAVISSYYTFLHLRLSWTALLVLGLFIAIFLLVVFLQLFGVALMHLIGKVLDGKGKLTEILWFTGLYSLQLLLLGKLIHLTMSLAGWLALLYIPLIIYGLFLDYHAVKASHLLSRGRSLVTAISAYVFKIMFMVMLGFVLYLLFIVIFMVGWFGGNMLLASDVQVTNEGGHTVYRNLDKGYAFTIPYGWNSTGSAEQEVYKMIGMRAFMKNNSGMIIVWEGLFTKLSEEAEFSEADCQTSKAGSGSVYKDFGNVEGCEVFSGNQIMFTGTACGSSPIFIQVQFLAFTSWNETTTAYESMMESLTCEQQNHSI